MTEPPGVNSWRLVFVFPELVHVGLFVVTTLWQNQGYVDQPVTTFSSLAGTPRAAELASRNAA
jgi:hypothetical protein